MLTSGYQGTVLREEMNTTAHTAHGRVAMVIHNSISYDNIDLQTPIQAVAIRARLHTTVTICNMYVSRAQALNYQLIDDVYKQLPQPAILIDFNAYSSM